MQRRPQHLRSLVKRFLARTRSLPMRTMGSGRRRYRGRGVTRRRTGMASTSSSPGFLRRHAKKIGALAGIAGLTGLNMLRNRGAAIVAPPAQLGHGRRRMTNLPMAY
jgi:hypothetical protein